MTAGRPRGGPDHPDDIRSDAAERLLEESWEARSRGVDRRELLTEVVAGLLFGLGAVALLLVPGALSGFDVATAVVLVVLYTLVSRVEFPVGAGYVFPSQLVLVPMLMLLPPATVPLLVAAGLVFARAFRPGPPPRLGSAPALRDPRRLARPRPGARARHRRRAAARPLQPSAAGRRAAVRLPLRRRLARRCARRPPAASRRTCRSRSSRTS